MAGITTNMLRNCEQLRGICLCHRVWKGGGEREVFLNGLIWDSVVKQVRFKKHLLEKGVFLEGGKKMS